MLVSFVEEVATSALLKIRSQYDVWPDGLRMKMDEVDISEHDDIKNTFVVDFSLDFYLVDEINGKEFISQQIYDPVGCFSLPRKSQASLGIHVPPLPNENIISLDIDNVVDPKAIKIQRSTNKNIINTILYKYETLATDPDTFTQTTLSLDSAAISQLNVGRRSKVIEAQGMRTALSAEARATATASRRLKKYSKGAEFLNGVKVLFKDGFNVEVGDKFLLDFSSLQISDIQSGTRSGDSRIMEVDNKRINLKTGLVTFNLVDTNFDKDTRFGLIAATSKIKSATDGTTWVIEPSFGSRFGDNEYRKWEKYIGANIKIVSPDYTTRDGSAILTGISGNTVTVNTSVGFTPVAGDFMILDNYSNQTLEKIQTIFVHLNTGTSNFADGKVFYAIF